MSSYLLTSESVSEGHPDKVCDRISDSILDDLLSEDPEARVAVEALATTQRVVLAGEVSSKKNVIMNTDRFERVAREVVCEIGYRQKGFHYKHMTVDCFIHEQSHDIAIGIDSGKEGGQEGAGDQGIVFGYACKELDGMHYMPASIYYSHRILRLLSKTRKADSFSILEPDSKSQVTLVYEDGRPVRADTIVVSTQHSADASQKDVHELVMHHLEMVFPKGWIPPKDRIYINPTGRFIIGGPDGDTGLTGRKIIVDTYGERAPHGGGAFSGKDPTKVDRSGAYMARYLAKNIVATGKTDRCLVQIAYAIGVSYPLAIYLHMGHGHDTNEKKLIRALLNREIVDLSPRGIREHLGLGRPIYTPTSAYGHFGRRPEANGSFSWERLDLVDAILSVIK